MLLATYNRAHYTLGAGSSLAKYLGHLCLVFLAAGKLEILEARAECFQ